MVYLHRSPDATQIAFESSSVEDRTPMIRVIDVASGVVRDVRPGTAPFWSPDGRALGSVSPQQAIEIGPPVTGAVRTLPLRGVMHADWQPRAPIKR